jgi:hypothetical protein
MENDLIMEMFDDATIAELNEICDSFDITDNNLRADEIMDVLDYKGFKELGCGTNRICARHKHYKDYAIKIALDNRGITDNNIEYNICKQPLLLKRAVQNFDNSGLILIADRVKIMDSETFSFHEKEIFEILDELSSEYILNDVGPSSFRNWGIDRNGIIRIADYAYLSRIEDVKITKCVKCGGKLRYTEDYKQMQCKGCGKIYNFADIKGDTYTDAMAESGWVLSETESIRDNNDISKGWV